MAAPKKRNTSNHNSGSSFTEDTFFVKLFYNSPTPKSISKLSDRTLVDVNQAWEQFTGYSRKDAIGFKVEELNLVSVKEADRIREIFDKTRTVRSFEVEFQCKDGALKYGLVSIQHLEVLEVGYVQTSIIDITYRKKAEIQLKLAKEFSDKLIMSMQEGLIIVDLEGKIILANNSTCEILGYSEEELVGLGLPYPFARMEDFEEITRTNEKVAKGENPSFQFEFIKKNGQKFMASFLTGNIKNDKGEVIALFGTMKDISEELRAQQVLEEIAQKSTQKKNVIMELSGLVGSNYHKALHRITELSAKTLNVERVSVWKFNEDGNEIECEKLHHLTTGASENGLKIKREDNVAYFNSLTQNKTLSIEDAVNHKITKGFAKDYFIPFGITSKLDLLLQGDRGKNRIICFEHAGEPRSWTAEEQEFANSIANVVSLMVENTERKQAEQRLILTNEQLSAANTELNELRNQLEQENFYLRNELDLSFNYEDMVYGSAEFSNILSQVEVVAPTNATVLLLGESGTGKELLARAIHNISIRNTKALIKVNCSAIPRDLLESELFGHKKGSFTGAVKDKIGKFELADGGTLFLDEIGEMPLDMQPKILRFLQEGEIEVVGGTDLTKLDVRVIAATNRNLKEEVEKKQFREDLFFRLNVFPIEVPPLRHRKDDIPLLVEHFVDKFNMAYSRRVKYIPDAVMNKLKSYDWPGNIRELGNLMERAVILSNGDTLLIPGFESSAQKAKRLITEKDLSLEEVQRSHILQVLEQCSWKITGSEGASQILKLKPSTLRDKMAKLGIKRPSND